MLENRDLTAARQRKPGRRSSRPSPTCRVDPRRLRAGVRGQRRRPTSMPRGRRSRPRRRPSTAASSCSSRARSRAGSWTKRRCLRAGQQPPCWPRRSTCARCNRVGKQEQIKTARRAGGRPRAVIYSRSQAQLALLARSAARSPASSPTARSTPARWPAPARRCSP